MKKIIILGLIFILIPLISAVSNVQHSVDGNKINLTFQGTPPFWINIRKDNNIGQPGGYVWARTNSNIFTIDMDFAVNPNNVFYYGVKDDEWSGGNSFEIVEQNLKSDFFKNDNTAQFIISGNDYQLKDQNLFVDNINYNINTLSFEYKLINAFRQLGYKRLTTWPDDPSAPRSAIALRRFQIKHNLAVKNQLDKSTLLLIDLELFQKEQEDKILAEQYPPFVKFIDAPINEPPKEHLAALYYRFFTAMPENLFDHNDTKAWTVDEFRWALITYGGNFGKMMDPAVTRVLSLDEMVDVVNNKDDFRFCGSAYYDKFNPTTNGDCVSPPDIILSGPVENINYMTMFIHEFGHKVGGVYYLEIDGEINRTDYHFGKISFYKSGDRWFWVRPEGDTGEFVSGYARTADSSELDPSTYIYPDYYVPAEDFAESFSAYIIIGNIFRERAKLNPYLQQKYDFLKTNVFNGKEFDTGNVPSWELWESKNSGIPWNPETYHIEDPDWVWDYQYKIRDS